MTNLFGIPEAYSFTQDLADSFEILLKILSDVLWVGDILPYLLINEVAVIGGRKV